MNVGQVRGSSSRGGATALKEMLALPADQHMMITPDGPRGPRRKIKLGPIFLASRSGRVIVPAAYAAVRAWRFQGTWTDLVVPRPFTTVYALMGQPIVIPANLSREQLLEAQVKVQAEMDALSLRAEQLAAGQSQSSATGKLRGPRHQRGRDRAAVRERSCFASCAWQASHNCRFRSYRPIRNRPLML